MSLIVENLGKIYGEKQVVRDVSFRVESGKPFGLLGRNGAGKTTIIRMILSIIKNDFGSIIWEGKSIIDSGLKFGYLPEERGLYPKVKVSDQLIYLAVLRGMSKQNADKALKFWLERFSISDYYNRRVDTLSKGNQQKIQLITAVIHDPDLIILDEPFNGLDPVNVEIFIDVIKDMSKNKKSIIFSDHMMEYVERICADILLLDEGITILSGNLKEIKRSYGRINLNIRCENDISQIISKMNIKYNKTALDLYKVKVENEEKGYELLRYFVDNGIKINKFEIAEPTLHEIFLEKVGN